MTRPLLLRPEALADVEDTCQYLEQARQGLGADFASHLRQLFERLESIPELYAAIWQDARAARLRKFRYVVYYVAFEDRVDILAVLHGARDASAWQSRA